MSGNLFILPQAAQLKLEIISHTITYLVRSVITKFLVMEFLLICQNFTSILKDSNIIQPYKDGAYKQGICHCFLIWKSNLSKFSTANNLRFMVFIILNLIKYTNYTPLLPPIYSRRWQLSFSLLLPPSTAPPYGRYSLTLHWTLPCHVA